MKIKTTVIEEKEIDIQIPFFRKDHTSPCLKLYAVLDSNTVVTVFQGGDRTSISNDALEERLNEDIAQAYAKWQPITEDEFFTHFNEAMKSLSLQPQLV